MAMRQGPATHRESTLQALSPLLSPRLAPIRVVAAGSHEIDQAAAQTPPFALNVSSPDGMAGNKDSLLPIARSSSHRRVNSKNSSREADSPGRPQGSPCSEEEMVQRLAKKRSSWRPLPVAPSEESELPAQQWSAESSRPSLVSAKASSPGWEMMTQDGAAIEEPAVKTTEAQSPRKSFTGFEVEAPRARRGSAQLSPRPSKARASMMARGPLLQPDVEAERPLIAAGRTLGQTAGEVWKSPDFSIGGHKVADVPESLIERRSEGSKASSRLTESSVQRERFTDGDLELQWQEKLAAQAAGSQGDYEYHSEAERKVREGQRATHFIVKAAEMPKLPSAVQSFLAQEPDPFEQSCMSWLKTDREDIEDREELIFELREVLKTAELERSQWKVQSKLMAAKLNPGYYRTSLSAALHWRDAEVDSLRKEIKKLELQQAAEQRQVSLRHNRQKKRSYDQARMQRLRMTVREHAVAPTDAIPNRVLGSRIDTVLDDNSLMAKVKLKRQPPKVEAQGGLRSTAFTNGGTEISLWGWELDDYVFRDADLALAAYVLPELPVLHPRVAEIEERIISELMREPDSQGFNVSAGDSKDSSGKTFVQTTRELLVSRGKEGAVLTDRGSDKSWMERSAESWAAAENEEKSRRHLISSSLFSSKVGEDEDQANHLSPWVRKWA